MCRRKLITLFLLLITNYLLAQNIPTPQLCGVSVDSNTNKPALFWTISDTNAISGFIIKRVIWNGSGVVDGTLNNVAVLPYPSLTHYIDTSSTYNTEALPSQRQETYVVTAYLDSNGNRYYSGFSQRESTIFLQSHYDTCYNTIKLTWKANAPSYKVWQLSPVHKLLTTTHDTAFTYKPMYNGNYSFVITINQSNTCNIDSLASNITKINISGLQRPKTMDICALQANFPDSIRIFVSLKMPQNNRPTVKLYRDSTVIATFKNDFNGYVTDINPNYKQNSYYLLSFSNCDKVIDKSNVSKNIVLTTSFIDQGQNKAALLNWTKYDFWQGLTDHYEIYFSVDGKNFNFLTNVQDTFYKQNLSDLIENGQLPSRLYYFVKAIESGNTNGQICTSTSNISVLEPPALIFAPNTILPNSPNPLDRVFKVYANFIDDFQLQIYSRDGNLIFSSNSVDKTWNATLQNGQRAPQGTYFYVITYRSQGKLHRLKGAVTVLY